MNREQERAELHKTIWAIANELRGSVDGWDFKQYVLGMLFYRFISENLTNRINKNEIDAGHKDFDYKKFKDNEISDEHKRDIVHEEGFFIAPSELFANVLANAKNNKNLNETLDKIFRNIENSAKGTESEKSIKGLFDDIDVNSSKLGDTVDKRKERLIRIMNAINDLKLGINSEVNIDVVGDAYEYLMKMYASTAGKSGGEFYTPQEVSELLAKITLVGQATINKIYDPACGSGSLMLKFPQILGRENIKGKFYGQEINITTFNLCRMNMLLHGINYNDFNIARGCTLTAPEHWDKQPFDVIVSNPPYSIKWPGDSDATLINDPRYAPAGVLAPKSKADLAFTMHMLTWLSEKGTAAIVEFPGVLYRGGAEQKIRKYMVDNNYVDCIIQLPSNLFFGTSIATCIMVLKKNKSNNDILFIDASNEFEKASNNNKLSETNIEKILNVFKNKEGIEYLSKLVSANEIEANDYNLSVSTYIEKECTKEVINIKVLNQEIKEIVKKQSKLRIELDEIIKSIEAEHA